ncbi:divalent metal cation transporter [Planosporangium sp. 12N6]|uniref:divalent metal cation transporter n=1 Tax=Planosporangium spinosum TaxID=3402278 RepID=UPI003CEE5213
MFSIIVATASTLHADGHHDLNSVADAARALGPAAGRWAGRWAGPLFALGFIGSGMLAIPVLAGSGSPAWPARSARSSGSPGRPARRSSATAWSPWARSAARRCP